MTELNEILYRLFIEEMHNLELGHGYDRKRLNTMKEICHLLTYYTYVDMDDTDVLKLIRFYEY